MKKIAYILISWLMLGGLHSCELFELDNYDEPAETLKGEVVDVATGERVLTDQGSEGTRIRLRELSWTASTTPNNFDFWCMKEGIFQNTKIFKGLYNIRIDGAFIPLVRLDQNGDTLANETKTMTIEGVTEVKFEVQPFLKIEWVGEPVANADGTITVQVKVTRAVSPADFRAKIQPMHNDYNDNFMNVTDVWLFVSEVQFVGYREKDDRYTNQVSYSGNSFETQLGQTVSITSKGKILPGRTMFVRVGARINYKTEGVNRWNYNEAKRVDMPR